MQVDRTLKITEKKIVVNVSVERNKQTLQNIYRKKKKAIRILI